METTKPSLTASIAAAVKAELARRDLSGNDLAPVLGLGRNAVYSRLRGEQPFDVDELQRIVSFLSISVDDLLASARLGEGVAA